jgi:hypothetical protein
MRSGLGRRNGRPGLPDGERLPRAEPGEGDQEHEAITYSPLASFTIPMTSGGKKPPRPPAAPTMPVTAPLVGVPEDLRPAEGVVRALKVVSQRFRLSGRALTPIPGAVRFARSIECPTPSRTPTRMKWPREQWLEIGALVELELD